LRSPRPVAPSELRWGAANGSERHLENVLLPADPAVAAGNELGPWPFFQAGDEAYNRENVELADVSSNPIERITPRVVRTGTDEYEFDMLVFATGFDASTGTMVAMDIRGKNGQTIKERWAGGPATYLGLAVDGFPNMFMISGPQSPFANIPVIIDNAARWIGRAITDIEERKLGALEPTAEAVEAWCKQMDVYVDATLLSRGEDVNSWFLGANIPRKPHVVLSTSAEPTHTSATSTAPPTATTKASSPPTARHKSRLAADRNPRLTNVAARRTIEWAASSPSALPGHIPRHEPRRATATPRHGPTPKWSKPMSRTGSAIG
jgi:hypothetical protein